MCKIYKRNVLLMECMTETLTRGYSSESAQGELSNEYQHDRVKMVFKNLCMVFVLDESSLSMWKG